MAQQGFLCLGAGPRVGEFLLDQSDEVRSRFELNIGEWVGYIPLFLFVS